MWTINGEPAKVSWRPVAVQRMDDTGAVAGQIKQGDRIVALGAHLCYAGAERVRWQVLPRPPRLKERVREARAF